MNANKIEKTVNKLGRMTKKTIDISVGGFMEQVGDKDTMTLAVTLGALHSLGTGSINTGAKTGAKTLVVLGSANIVYNVASNWQVIRNS